MQIENLFEKDLTELQKKVEELKKENPDITTRVYEGRAPITLDDIWTKLCEIDLRLSSAFNEHILVNGIWRKP